MIPLLKVRCSRAVFQGYFSEEMVRGCIALMSRSTGFGGRSSTAAPAVAGADEYELEKIVSRVDEFANNQDGSCT